MRRYLVDARARSPRFPGIGRVVDGLLPALTEAAADDEEIVALASEAGAWPSEVVVDAASPLSRGGLRGARRAIREVAPAVFHSPHLTLPPRPGAPAVVTVQDLIPLERDGGMSRVRRLGYRAVLHQALWSATHVLVPSEATARAAGRLRPHRPVTVVAHGVDQNRFRPRPAAEVAATRDRFGLDRPFVLSVAADRPHKNRATLVDAWRRAGLRGHDLVLVGDGPTEPAGEGVRPLGRVGDADLAPLYTGAEVTVVASRHEGFGLPVLEAMACRSPVACSAIPVLDEVAGDAAARFDPLDPDDLARVLGELAGDPKWRADLAERGRARAAGFTWAAAAEQTLVVYRGLAGAP